MERNHRIKKSLMVLAFTTIGIGSIIFLISFISIFYFTFGPIDPYPYGYQSNNDQDSIFFNTLPSIAIIGFILLMIGNIVYFIARLDLLRKIKSKYNDSIEKMDLKDDELDPLSLFELRCIGSQIFTIAAILTIPFIFDIRKKIMFLIGGMIFAILILIERGLEMQSWNQLLILEGKLDKNKGIMAAIKILKRNTLIYLIPVVGPFSIIKSQTNSFYKMIS